MEVLCSTCNDTAAVLCSCNYSYLCSSCVPSHLASTSTKIHCFQQTTHVIKHYSAVLKSSSLYLCKSAIIAEIAKIEKFKVDYTEAIHSRSALVIQQIREAVNHKTATLQTEVAKAKNTAQLFAKQLLAQPTRESYYETQTFFKNCIRLKANVKTLPYFRLYEAVATYEAGLALYCEAHLVFPTQILRDLTQNTLAEYSSHKPLPDNDCREEDRCISLFKEKGAVCQLIDNPYSEGITLTADRECFLTALRLGGSTGEYETCQIERLEVRMKGTIIYSHPNALTLGFSNEGYVKVNLSKAVRILKGVPHTISVVYREADVHFTFQGKLPSDCEGISIVFASPKLNTGDLLSYRSALKTNAIAGFYYNLSGVPRIARSIINFICHKPTHYGEVVIVVGSTSALGMWDPSKGLELKWTAGNHWRGSFEASEPFTFKYVLRSESTFVWESGPNRDNGSMQHCDIDVWNSVA